MPTGYAPTSSPRRPCVDPAGAAPHVVLGVCGGIAAYKSCELLRLFTESGHDVRVVPTASALRFVGDATWAALSGHPVATDVWTDAHDVPHVAIGRQAALVVIAPATADLLARMVAGRADDLLTATLLTVRCPVVVAPAMHTEMWEHMATRANVATLRRRGIIVLDPAVGRLTGADSGIGDCPSRAPSSRWRAPSCPAAPSCRSTCSAATSWSPPEALGSRWTRCATSATAPAAGRATR